ncbi:Riboflavin transporter MCH5 [Termitomyces sp. T112]|nr:Riboflavin transporter MCH5 [Termitomyces sp. T112]
MSVDSRSQTVRSISPPEAKEMPEEDTHRVMGVPYTPSGSIVDGGRDAWMTIAGTWLTQFCTYGYLSAFGVYQDYYTREFLRSRSPSDISWIGSFQLFMQYAPGVLVGRAFDAGYFRLMIASGSVIQVISMFMLSLTRPGRYYQVFLAQALGMGLGQALLFLPSITIISHHFKRRRAMATGVAVSGASVGGVVWPIMLNQLHERTSFANSIRVTAALVGVLLLGANILFKPRPLLKTQSNDSFKPAFKVIFQDAAYLSSIAAAFCINISLFFPYFYLQLYAISQGITQSLAFYVLAIINAGSFFGRILPNIFADKFGPYNMLIPCLVVSSGLVFCIFGIHDFVSIAIIGALYGFWSGSYVSLIPSLLAQLSTHMGEQGTRMGIAFSIVGLALLFGTPIEGALLDRNHGVFAWHKAIIFCGVMVCCGAIIMIISRYLFVRKHRGDQTLSRV